MKSEMLFIALYNRRLVFCDTQLLQKYPIGCLKYIFPIDGQAMAVL
jgi:hypothetical protein